MSQAAVYFDAAFRTVHCLLVIDIQSSGDVILPPGQSGIGKSGFRFRGIRSAQTQN